jgi:hypothetical protein
MPRTGGAKSNAASIRKSQVKRSSPTYRAIEVPLFPTPQPLSQIPPWYKAGGRKAQLCHHLLDILRDVASNHR